MTSESSSAITSSDTSSSEVETSSFVESITSSETSSSVEFTASSEASSSAESTTSSETASSFESTTTSEATSSSTTTTSSETTTSIPTPLPTPTYYQNGLFYLNNSIWPWDNQGETFATQGQQFLIKTEHGGTYINLKLLDKKDANTVDGVFQNRFIAYPGAPYQVWMTWALAKPNSGGLKSISIQTADANNPSNYTTFLKSDASSWTSSSFQTDLSGNFLWQMSLGLGSSAPVYYATSNLTNLRIVFERDIGTQDEVIIRNVGIQMLTPLAWPKDNLQEITLRPGWVFRTFSAGVSDPEDPTNSTTLQSYQSATGTPGYDGFSLYCKQDANAPPGKLVVAQLSVKIEVEAGLTYPWRTTMVRQLYTTNPFATTVFQEGAGVPIVEGKNGIGTTGNVFHWERSLTNWNPEIPLPIAPAGTYPASIVYTPRTQLKEISISLVCPPNSEGRVIIQGASIDRAIQGELPYGWTYPPAPPSPTCPLNPVSKNFELANFDTATDPWVLYDKSSCNCDFWVYTGTRTYIYQGSASGEVKIGLSKADSEGTVFSTILLRQMDRNTCAGQLYTIDMWWYFYVKYGGTKSVYFEYADACNSPNEWITAENGAFTDSTQFPPVATWDNLGVRRRITFRPPSSVTSFRIRIVHDDYYANDYVLFDNIDIGPVPAIGWDYGNFTADPGSLRPGWVTESMSYDTESNSLITPLSQGQEANLLYSSTPGKLFAMHCKGPSDGSKELAVMRISYPVNICYKAAYQLSIRIADAPVVSGSGNAWLILQQGLGNPYFDLPYNKADGYPPQGLSNSHSYSSISSLSLWPNQGWSTTQSFLGYEDKNLTLMMVCGANTEATLYLNTVALQLRTVLKGG